MSDENRLLKGDFQLETALYSTAVAQEGIMQREGRGLITRIKSKLAMICSWSNMTS